MPKLIINGSIEPQLQMRKIKHDPTSGTTTTTDYACPPFGDMQGLANVYQDRKASYELTYGQRQVSLSATETTHFHKEEENEVPEPRWELISNQNQADIKEHPTFATLDEDQRRGIVQDAE